MDEYVPPRYTIELWHRGKTKVADITRLAKTSTGACDRNGVESLDFNMSMPDWEGEVSTDRRESKHYLEAVGERHQSQAKRRVFVCVVVVEANRNPITDNARVLCSATAT